MIATINNQIVKVKKKPTFSRTDSHKKKRLGIKWRRPKGIQNKRRLKLRSYAPIVKKGYRTSNETRGQTKEGLTLVVVSSLSELKLVESSKAIIISGRVGNRKRLELLEEAQKLKLQIINHTDKKIQEIKDSFAQRKKKKQDIKKEEEEKAKAEKKKTIEESVKKEEAKQKETEDDSKDKEKKDFDKLLTKKQ